jgi:hypothetical protein
MIQICFCDEHTVRIFDIKTQMVTTILGMPGRAGRRYGAATVTLLREPLGLAADPAGNIYIADTGNDRINFFETSTGEMHTLIYQAQEGATPDQKSTNADIVDGHGRGTMLRGPCALRLNLTDGRLLIAERDGHRLRRVVTPPAMELARPEFYQLLTQSTKTLRELMSSTLADYRRLGTIFQQANSAVDVLSRNAVKGRQSHFAREAKRLRQHYAKLKAPGSEEEQTAMLGVLLMALPRIHDLGQLLDNSNPPSAALTSVLFNKLPDLIQQYHWQTEDVLVDLTMLWHLVSTELLSVHSLSLVFLSEGFQSCSTMDPTNRHVVELLRQIIDLATRPSKRAATVSETDFEVLTTAVVRWLWVHQQRWSTGNTDVDAALSLLLAKTGLGVSLKPSPKADGAVSASPEAPALAQHGGDRPAYSFSPVEVSVLWWTAFTTHLTAADAGVAAWLLSEQMQRLCSDSGSQLKSVLAKIPAIMLICKGASPPITALLEHVVSGIRNGARYALQLEWRDLTPLVCATRGEFLVSPDTPQAQSQVIRVRPATAEAAVDTQLLRQREALYRIAAATANLVFKGDELTLDNLLVPGQADFVASFLSWYKDELASRSQLRLYAEEGQEAARAWTEVLNKEQAMRQALRRLKALVHDETYTPTMLSAMQRIGERFLPLWKHIDAHAAQDPRKHMQTTVSQLRDRFDTLHDICDALLLYSEDAELLQTTAKQFGDMPVRCLRLTLRCSPATDAMEGEEAPPPTVDEGGGQISGPLSDALPWLSTVYKLHVFQSLWGKPNAMYRAMVIYHDAMTKGRRLEADCALSTWDEIHLKA